MARRKKSKASQGGGIGAALVGICVAAYNWVVGHMDIVIIVTVAVVAFIILLIIAKRIRIRKYWAWYLSRERGLQELGTQYLLQEETDDAMNRNSRNIEGCWDSNYVELSNACEKSYGSDEIVWLEGNSVKYSGTCPFSGEDLVGSINLHTDGTLATIFCKTDEDGGYTFVLLPDAIYAFITGGGSYTFVGAYDKRALNLKVDHMHYQKTYTHITDMSHQPRGYFLKYCDIHDSRAAAAGWQYETKNGYRDGRRQGNNYFIVKFIYSRVDFTFGNMTSSVAFSFTDSGDRMKAGLESYRKMVSYKAPTVNVTETEHTDEDILAAVTKDRPQPQIAENSSEATNESNPVSDDAIIKPGPISCDEARSRNRDIAKALQDRLNQEYPNFEFKVFQIKKQREDRDLQDASVYTYIPDGNSRHCLEFNVKTNLENGSTVLEYILTADDDALLEGESCQRIIRQNRMRKVGSSYRTDFGFDYSKYCQDDPVTHMFLMIKTHMEKDANG